MEFSAARLAATLGGALAGPEVTVDGVSTDTRTLRPGQLFVPLVDRRDGHAHLAGAVAAGAPAYLTAGPLVAGATGIVVPDTAAALMAIGGIARQSLPDRVVAVTGSVGKTTVKDLAAGALATTFTTCASPMSFNNEIGVPLTLANADERTEATVVEMGARGIGHIRSLCDIARPGIGVVTRVGEAHTEFFGHLDQVAEAKAELVVALPPSGTAVLNADDELVAAMAGRTRARVLFYGTSPAAEVTAHHVVFDDLVRPAFRLVTPHGSVELALGVHGHHQVMNALAAAGAALSAGVPLAAVAEGLAGVGAPAGRMAVSRTGRGVVVVNDSYNANPVSVRAALEALSGFAGARKVAVLGGMAELGGASAEHHRSVADLAGVLGIELVAFSTADFGVEPVGTVAGVLARLADLGPGDVVLVKGSRAVGMEQVAEALAAALAE